jgi:STE24 endopeptidase
VPGSNPNRVRRITSDFTPQPPRDTQQAEAKRYGRRRLACALADKAIDLAVLAVFTLAARTIDAWLTQTSLLARNDSLRLLALLVVIFVVQLAVSFPLAFYSGYLLERSFQLTTLTPARWLKRFAGRSLLGLALAAPLMLGLYWIIWTTGGRWWLVAAGAFFVVSVVFGQLAPVLIVPLFYKVERIDVPELTERIGRLAAGTGLSIEGVYRIALSTETVKANAALAGIGRTRRVLLGDTLLSNFTPAEIEVIFAHEIGHHVFHHLWRMIASGAISAAAVFWLTDRGLAWWVAGQGGPADPAQLPAWTLPGLLLALSVLGLLLEPIQNTIVRSYERQCDRYALQRTGQREAYRSAFEKLARLNKADTDPPRLEVILFHSHPPIGERLKMAE